MGMFQRDTFWIVTSGRFADVCAALSRADLLWCAILDKVGDDLICTQECTTLVAVKEAIGEALLPHVAIFGVTDEIRIHIGDVLGNATWKRGWVWQGEQLRQEWAGRQLLWQGDMESGERSVRDTSEQIEPR
ncbi:MAG: hypothetical protein AB7K09_22930 [Planctomycetota bacterium]